MAASLDDAASQWQDGASAATGHAAFVAPPGMDPPLVGGAAAAALEDSVGGGTGSGAARLPPPWHLPVVSNRASRLPTTCWGSWGTGWATR